jgi:hypothetical protein
MAEPRASDLPAEIRQRFADLGHTLGAREQQHADDLERARARAEDLRADVAAALAEFHRAAAEAGAPHIAVELGALRPDEKHLRAVEFDVSRGRHRALVTAKSRGEVTLVGPFHRGKTEGPCKSFPFEADAEIREALADFLAKFLEAAATP